MSPPFLLAIVVLPALQILGENDRSIPLRRTVEVLTQLSRAKPKTLTIRVIPGVNHRLVDPATGRRPDYWATIGEWLRAHGVVRN